MSVEQVDQVTQDDLLKLPIYFFLDDDEGYKSEFLKKGFHDNHSDLIGDIAEHNDVKDNNVSGVRWKFKKVRKSDYDKLKLGFAQRRCFIMNLQNNTCEQLNYNNNINNQRSDIIEFISPKSGNKYNSRIIQTLNEKSYRLGVGKQHTIRTINDLSISLTNDLKKPIGTDVYPICHSVVSKIIIDWVKLVMGNKHHELYPIYKNMQLYNELNELFHDKKFIVCKLIQRLLTKRPIAFYGPGDYYVTRDNKTDGSFYNSSPNVKDYITYDECIISALIGVSNETYTLRDNPFNPYGDCNNSDTDIEKDNRIKKTILVGQVGARFERAEYMESTYIDKDASRNPVVKIADIMKDTLDNETLFLISNAECTVVQ